MTRAAVRTAVRSTFNDDSKTRARHLLRALLRQASYLPDATARTFVRQRILARFRDSLGYDRDVERKLPQLLESGYKHLRQLDRANNGEKGALFRVLRHTYGRAGKRRYELMKAVLTESDPVDQDSQTSLDDGIGLEVYGYPLKLPRAIRGPFKTEKETLQFRISERYPVLKALAESQATFRLDEDPEIAIRSAHFDMPLKNIWHRIQPRCRQRNAATRWYADLLSKVLPPLPEHEWHELRELALGVRQVSAPPRFRSLSPHSSTTPLLNSRRRTTDRVSRKFAVLEFTPETAQDILETELRNKRFKSPTKVDFAHAITSRFMRKLYTAVLQECPLVTYDEAASKWTVRWFEPLQTPSTSKPLTTPESQSDEPKSPSETDALRQANLSLLLGPLVPGQRPKEDRRSTRQQEPIRPASMSGLSNKLLQDQTEASRAP